MADKITEDGELRIELPVGFMERLQENRIFGQKISAKAGLFIHHELEEVIGVGDDQVGVIDHASAALNILQAQSKDECKGSEG